MVLHRVEIRLTQGVPCFDKNDLGPVKREAAVFNRNIKRSLAPQIPPAVGNIQRHGLVRCRKAILGVMNAGAIKRLCISVIGAAAPPVLSRQHWVCAYHIVLLLLKICYRDLQVFFCNPHADSDRFPGQQILPHSALK